MEFRIADTFTGSLARLNNEEQKAAKTTAFDLQLNPAGPSMQLHRIEQSKDPNFWSEQRRPSGRASHGVQPASVLRRSPRRGLPLGAATPAGDAPEDRGSAVRGDP